MKTLPDRVCSEAAIDLLVTQAHPSLNFFSVKSSYSPSLVQCTHTLFVLEFQWGYDSFYALFAIFIFLPSCVKRMFLDSFPRYFSLPLYKYKVDSRSDSLPTAPAEHAEKRETVACPNICRIEATPRYLFHSPSVCHYQVLIYIP